MDEKDSVDFTNRVELLLRIMTKECTEDSESSNDSDYSFSSNESDSESEENDVMCPDLNGDSVGNLSKFFEEHVEGGKKHSPSTMSHDIENHTRSEGKMYRVLPIKLDEKIFKSKQPVASNRT
ncbi:uncharacterized protein LOC143376040 isoform X2 [Andrena cerasifolii]|uniref:uncharacterized protein LOC143376040 isoform X2 n=1 Tax=Andrena cerasifolii TaxID=2819439 RepID=UPI004037B9F6